MSDWNFLNIHRINQSTFKSDPSFGFNGAFSFPISGEARRILCIASDGMLWKHVSVSFGGASNKTPSWEIMNAVKDLFWEPEDCVVQYHPPRSQYVNNHPGCLHLWEMVGAAFPMPPSILVGYVDAERTMHEPECNINDVNPE